MPRILVVDDEKGIRTLLSIAFTRAGHEVQTAATALEAMALCAEGSFDAMLSDVQMPHLDGHDLVRWVVKNHPTIRCALMSAFEERDCLDCPFFTRCQTLPKPFVPKEAVLLVERLLKEPDAAS